MGVEWLEGTSGVGCREGVPSSPLGVDLRRGCPFPRENFLNSSKNAGFYAFLLRETILVGRNRELGA